MFPLETLFRQAGAQLGPYGESSAPDKARNGTRHCAIASEAWMKNASTSLAKGPAPPPKPAAVVSRKDAGKKLRWMIAPIQPERQPSSWPPPGV